jgi:hypothetical protein
MSMVLRLKNPTLKEWRKKKVSLNSSFAAPFFGDNRGLNSGPHAMHSTIWDIPPVHFCFNNFSDKVLCFCLRLALNHKPNQLLLISTSGVAGITDVSHCAWAIQCELFLYLLVCILTPNPTFIDDSCLNCITKLLVSKGSQDLLASGLSEKPQWLNNQSALTS